MRAKFKYILWHTILCKKKSIKFNVGVKPRLKKSEDYL